MFSCTSLTDTPLASHAGCLCHRPEIHALTRRISADLSRRGFVAGMSVSAAVLGLPRRVSAQPASVQPPRSILFTNFRLFDGKSGLLARRASSARRRQSDQSYRHRKSGSA